MGTNRHSVVVAYDISDDKARTRFHEILGEYGVPQNRSVFECRFSKKELEMVKSRAEALIDAKTDSVLFYFLCRRCEANRKTLGCVRQFVRGISLIT